MTTLENASRLYAIYRSMGLDKSAILRKLKAQIAGARFEYKGATLYASFGANAKQKV